MVKIHTIKSWHYSKPGRTGGIAYTCQGAEGLRSEGYSVVEKTMPRVCYYDRSDAGGLVCPGCHPGDSPVKWILAD